MGLLLFGFLFLFLFNINFICLFMGTVFGFCVASIPVSDLSNLQQTADARRNASNPPIGGECCGKFIR